MCLRQSESVDVRLTSSDSDTRFSIPTIPLVLDVMDGLRALNARIDKLEDMKNKYIEDDSIFYYLRDKVNDLVVARDTLQESLQPAAKTVRYELFPDLARELESVSERVNRPYAKVKPAPVVGKWQFAVPQPFVYKKKVPKQEVFRYGPPFSAFSKIQAEVVRKQLLAARIAKNKAIAKAKLAKRRYLPGVQALKRMAEKRNRERKYNVVTVYPKKTKTYGDSGYLPDSAYCVECNELKEECGCGNYPSHIYKPKAKGYFIKDLY